jgi:hypothetical protein
MVQETLAKHMICMDVFEIPSPTTPNWEEKYGRVIGERLDIFDALEHTVLFANKAV